MHTSSFILSPSQLRNTILVPPSEMWGSFQNNPWLAHETTNRKSSTTLLQSKKPHRVLRCILSYHSRGKTRCSWEKNYRANTKGLPVEKNIVRLLKSRRQRNDAFGFLRAKDFQVRILCLGKLSIKREEYIFWENIWKHVVWKHHLADNFPKKYIL